MIGDHWIRQNGITVTWKNLNSAKTHPQDRGHLNSPPLEVLHHAYAFYSLLGTETSFSPLIFPLEVAEVKEERNLGIKEYIERVTQEARH